MRRNDGKSQSDRLLAFCHIEKAAGTSLIHILRRIFFLRYAAVRPLRSRDEEFFTARDLKIARRINPFLLAVGGHSVVPYAGLLGGEEKVDFITQVREPIARASSQYRHWVKRLKFREGWAAFLRHPISRNFQVKKIAGCEDLDLAKEIISKDFLLAGTVNQFDAFLVLLADKLGISMELFTYSQRNVDTDTRHLEMPNMFFDQLRERNQLDQKLFEWIDTQLLAEYISAYSGAFSADLEKFRAIQREASPPVIKPLVDSVYRNAYLKPISGLIRVSNGLPFTGSYATR